jgi:putative methyltransferase (TIGR04325 family)
MSEPKKEAEKPIWEGVYATFAETGAEPAFFEGTGWLDRIVTRAQQFIDRMAGATVPAAAMTTEYALPFVAAMIAVPGRPLRILDFGGSMGTSYLPLRAMLPKDRALDFVVVENAAVCKKGDELFANDESLHFRTDMPSAPEKFDIVHFGSSLHYVDDWKGLLDTSSALAPDYLIFTDLPAADNRSFVTTQWFAGRRIAVRFWNVAELIAAVSEMGFELLLQQRFRGYFSDENAERPTANFDEAHRLRYTCQLVFRRVRAT